MASWAVVHRTPVMTEANKTWGEIEAEVGERERGRTDIQLVENVLHYYSIGLFNIFERCV